MIKGKESALPQRREKAAQPAPSFFDEYFKSDLFKEDCKLMDEIFKDGFVGRYQEDLQGEAICNVGSLQDNEGMALQSIGDNDPEY